MLKLFICAILLFFGLRLWAVGRTDVNVDDGGTSATSSADFVNRGQCPDGRCAAAVTNVARTHDRKEYAELAYRLNRTDTQGQAPPVFDATTADDKKKK